MILKSRKPELLWAAIESAAWLTVVGLGALAGVLGELSVREASLLCILIMLGLIWLAWKNFEGGRHPCFLFLGMLFIFQCGSLPGFWTGVPSQPFLVNGAVWFSVSDASKEITLLLIALSAVCVYTVCRMTYRRVVLLPGAEQHWLNPLYTVLIVTLPFALYKNYIYLEFLRSHGGYMAIYTDSQALLHSAGLLVRSIALISTTVLLLLYTFERRKKHVILLLGIFLAVSIMSLLIGLRGKVFVEVLLFWYIRNLKTGKKFNIFPLLIAAVAVSMLAVVIAAIRQEAAIKVISPIGFLAGQGVSVHVTELAVQYRSRFEPRIVKYLLNEIIVSFTPASASSIGHSFDTDLSYFVNPMAASMGYGTGGSYLAEAYLFGGVGGVALASLAVGGCLSFIHRLSRNWIGALFLAAALGPIIYMPRTGLVSPVSFTLKSLLVMVVAALLIPPVNAFVRLFLMSCRRRPSVADRDLRPTLGP